MTDMKTPICDLIARLLSAGMSGDDAISAARPVEVAMLGTATASKTVEEKAAIRREQDAARKREARKKRPADGVDEKGGYISSSASMTLNKMEEEEKKDSPKSAKRPADKPDVLSDWPKDFEVQFWNSVPRRVSKAEAMKALQKVRRSGLPWATLTAGIARWVAETKMTEPKFIKHPATWLNKGCWDDEPTPPTNGGPGGQASNYPQRTNSADAISAAARRRAGSVGEGEHGHSPRPINPTSPSVGRRADGGEPEGDRGFDLDLRAAPRPGRDL